MFLSDLVNLFFVFIFSFLLLFDWTKILVKNFSTEEMQRLLMRLILSNFESRRHSTLLDLKRHELIVLWTVGYRRQEILSKIWILWFFTLIQLRSVTVEINFVICHYLDVSFFENFRWNWQVHVTFQKSILKFEKISEYMFAKPN